MPDTRIPLPRGTVLRLLATGSVFEVTGKPIGYGGGGLIYPARRMVLENGALVPDGICYALKECYPASGGCYRDASGAILAGAQNVELEKARQRHVAEKERNQAIHLTANRMLPILEADEKIELTQPGRAPAVVANAVSVMESLENKGRSLADCLAERRRFSALETCRILQQMLFALREVHNAGYLHLDIQGGNVFLRGTLADSSDFVTLIDFGSARPMEADGKTAPIRDGEIFTSRGFSAPEMLLSNTGALRLGREADLYSLGCVALYLLTGQRPNQSQLLVSQPGNYLKPNQLRRVDCPAHLQGQLQALLTMVLAKDPAERCASAEELLEKVNALLEALKPSKSVLSTVKYDAFLCYKHGTVDSPAAKALRQRLEHFHTTDNAGKRIRPFRNVFLDEGELSACRDFGQMIRDALRNSRYLLVICSEDTPQSPWVKLEIETFQEIHGGAARERIFTILTSGEPEASLPPVLLESAGGEPFAVDIRGKDLGGIRKNLRGDAFLRLAAAMLNRPFDALKQRQKIYALQRVAAVTGACLLATAMFAAYAVNRAQVIETQAARIQQEYETALVNESLMLAEQAEKQLSSNNTLEAMALARAALPSASQSRPVVAEAEYALGKALGIYISPGAAEGTASPVATIDTEDDSFFLDDTGSLLFTWENYEYGIRVWDGETLSLLWELAPRDKIYSTSRELLAGQDALLYSTYGGVVNINYRTGEETWRVSQEGVQALCLTEDKSRLVVLWKQEYWQTRETTCYLDTLSVATGEWLGQVSFRMEGSETYGGYFSLSPDGRFAAVTGEDHQAEMVELSYPESLYLIDLTSGNCNRLLENAGELLAAEFLEDRLVIFRGHGYSLTTRHGNADYNYVKPVDAQIEVYDPTSGSLVWSRDYRYHTRSYSLDELKLVPYDTGTVSGRGLLVVCADRCLLLDWDSGETVREYELQGEALDITCYANGFETLNADGSTTMAAYTLDQMRNIRYFEDSVSAICRYGDSFYVQSTPLFSRDYSIRKYVLNKSDENYTPLFEAYLTGMRFYEFRRMAEGLRLVTAEDGQITCMDSWNGATVAYTPPAQTGFSEYQVAGLSADGQRLYWWGKLDYEKTGLEYRPLWVIDLTTGESRAVPIPAQPEGYLSVQDSLLSGDAILFTATIFREGEQEVGVFRWELTEGTLEELYRCTLAPAQEPEDEEKWSRWENYKTGSMQLDDQVGAVSFATCINGLDTPHRLIRVSLSGEEAVEITLSFTPEKSETETIQWKTDCLRWNRDGTLAMVGYGDSVYVTGRDGELLCQVPALEHNTAAWFLPDGAQLLVLTNDRCLRQYRISDGAELAVIDLSEYMNTTSYYSEDVVLTQIDETTLALFTGWNGLVLDASGDVIKVRATVHQGIGYDAGTDSFLVAEGEHYSGEPSTVGVFPRYSLEDLLEKADAILEK